MNKRFAFVSAIVFAVATAAASFASEEIPIWPDVAPGETADSEKPTIEILRPEVKTSDACIIVCPGGAYNVRNDREGTIMARYFVDRGATAVLLKYRVPRREGRPKHLAPWQDVQRAIRVVRSRAADLGIDPNKIGTTGFSAGAHLTLMAATSSLTPSYEPIDELDKIPCDVAFAIPVYPAYVLEDGADGENTGKGNDSPMVDDFAFDAKTPPICLFHGDADAYSPMGSVAVYAKLRKMNIPAELHIYVDTPHGFVGSTPDNHARGWEDRAFAWTKAMGFF